MIEFSEAERLVLLSALRAYLDIVKAMQQERVQKHIRGKYQLSENDQQRIQAFNEFYTVEAIVIERLIDKVSE